MRNRSAADLEIVEVLAELPLFDDLFLMMQARNISMVDRHIEDLEGEVRKLFYKNDNFPIVELAFINALGQMWVFAVYELLRTWKQRTRRLLALSEEVAPLRGKVRQRRIGEAMAKVRGVVGDTIANESQRAQILWACNANGRRSLAKALSRVLPLFRRLEALRIALAKHEVAGTGRNSPAFVASAPGYVRLDSETGSATWMFEYKDGMSDILSRNGVATAIKALHNGGRTAGPDA